MVDVQVTFRTKIKSQGRIVIQKTARDEICVNTGDDVTVTVRKTKEVKM